MGSSSTGARSNCPSSTNRRSQHRGVDRATKSGRRRSSPTRHGSHSGSQRRCSASTRNVDFGSRLSRLVSLGVEDHAGAAHLRAGTGAVGQLRRRAQFAPTRAPGPGVDQLCRRWRRPSNCPAHGAHHHRLLGMSARQAHRVLNWCTARGARRRFLSPRAWWRASKIGATAALRSGPGGGRADAA